jgi:hypothetical protein
MKGLDHFVRLAKRGKPNTGASSGELRARRLALAILDNLPGLDDRATSGLLAFIELVKQSPEESRTLVDGWDESE